MTVNTTVTLPLDYEPSEDEPFMNELQREYFRQKLLIWREELVRESSSTLQNLQDDTGQAATTLAKPSQ